MSAAGGAPGPSETPEASAGFEVIARQAAVREKERQGGGLRRELLLLSLGGDPYALPVERVREIVRLRPITPIPRVPDSVRGVISLRGEIVQVIDLRSRLGLEASQKSPSSAERRRRIVVLHTEDGQMAGVLVDRVSDVLRVPEEALRSAGSGSQSVVALVEHGSGFVSLIDVDRVLDLGPSGAAEE